MASLGLEYQVAMRTHFTLPVAAIFTRDERYHHILPLAMFGYQLSWALRFFQTVA